MVVSNRGAGFGWGGALDDEIRRLVELVTELGIEVENILFDAVTALLGEGTVGAQQARQAGDDCERRYQVAHQLGLDLIMDGRATADQARWIMELQEMGQAFRHISQDSVRIAALSLALQPPVRMCWRWLGRASICSNIWSSRRGCRCATPSTLRPHATASMPA